MTTAAGVLPDLLDRHRRFWRSEAADRPLFGASREGAFFLQPFVDLGVRDGALDIADVPPPEAFIPAYFDPTLAGDPLDGELFWVLKPPRAVPWMEAIAGCGVHVTGSSGAMTAVQPDALPDLAALDLAANPWLRLMTDFTQALARCYGGRYPVGQTLMRGPSDMLAALLGQQFFVEMYDNPGAVKALARQCADLWIRVLQIQYEHMPRYQGGYLAGIMGLWAPGQAAVYQEDAAGFVSEAMYREFFLECDAAIASAFDYSLLHLHSASLQILGAVLEIPGLDAVNVVVDPLGPSVPDLIPDLQRIQQAGKALHLHSARRDLPDEQIELVRASLKPEGLAIWLVRDD